MPYTRPLFVDQMANDIENCLTAGCIIPILGIGPGLLKSIFGVTQILAASATLICSLAYLYSTFGRNMFFHASRHMVHGIANIVSGLLLAIPLIGSLIVGIHFLKLVQGEGNGVMVSYHNDQTHKFFAYKTIEDTTWKRNDNIGGYCGPVSPDDLPTQQSGEILKARFSL